MGRKKDTIKTGGENVHAEEVEAWLASHPGVAAAAVVGLPDEALGERVSVLVQLRGGWIWNEASSEEEHGQRKFGLSELQQHCVRVGMSRYKIPRVGLGTREPLPVNAAGKVLKHDVRVRLLAHFTPHQDSKL
jgi:acyl-CoA synthetase (AMP-forming)/AMP-acid ligase II